jgi:DNA-binding Lrp family transcriptional regulator
MQSLSFDHRDGGRVDAAGLDEVIEMPVGQLRLGESIRAAGADDVGSTFVDPTSWSPIVVARTTLTVVDGHRRLRAARRLGLDAVRVRRFDGDDTDAIVEFVRLNMRDGSELDRPERREASRRILSLHPDWSDRRVGEVCHISPKTVAEVRSGLRTSGDAHMIEADARVGRDGRVRPLDSRAQRAKIVEAIKANPRASLRAIAAPIGVSPETVRRVRAAMAEDGSLEGEPAAPVDFQIVYFRRHEPAWQPDSAFTSRHEAAEIAEFLERTDTSTIDPEQHARAIPLSRVYEVADEARRRSAFWLRLAESVENRSRKACY